MYLAINIVHDLLQYTVEIVRYYFLEQALALVGVQNWLHQDISV